MTDDDDEKITAHVARLLHRKGLAKLVIEYRMLDHDFSIGITNHAGVTRYSRTLMIGPGKLFVTPLGLLHLVLETDKCILDLMKIALPDTAHDECCGSVTTITACSE